MEIFEIRTAFERMYHERPIIVRSPGRINIIGEHIDYNDGLVMPAAINKAIYVAIAARTDNHIHLYSENYQQSYTTALTDLRKAEKSWINYVLGVADEVQKRGYRINGFNLFIWGNVPLGVGLSSSAALECAMAYALDQLFELGIRKTEIALIAQKAEHVFAGVNCGIMDQFASVFGQKDQAILLDCRTLAYEYIPIEMQGYKLVLLNTNVKHSLAESGYNARRAQCEQGIAWIKIHCPEVSSLRDVDQAMLDRYVKPLDEDVYRKCLFVVKEILRVANAAEQLKAGNLNALGALMVEAHDGLSNDYEVSCTELDFLADAVKDVDYVLGSRMMGGGFGGCTLNIVREEYVDALVENVSAAYQLKFGRKLDAYTVTTGDGTMRVDD